MKEEEEVERLLCSLLCSLFFAAEPRVGRPREAPASRSAGEHRAVRSLDLSP